MNDLSFYGYLCVVFVAGCLVGGMVMMIPPYTSNHPITQNGAADYDILIENLGEQVRLTTELSALQDQKIQKLQQQIEIFDDAGLRSCDYLQRTSIEITALQKALEAATIDEVDINQVRQLLEALRVRVNDATQDVKTIFLASPVYHVDRGIEDES